MHLSKETNTDYERILKRTTKSVYYVFLIVAITAFLYGSRTTVWIEYANTFNDSSPVVISWVMYLDALFIAIVGIFFSTLGDYIGFDKSITLKVLLITIGCVIEAFATTFFILCVGFLISQTAISYVSLGYISYILPTKYAKQQVTNNHIVGVLCFVVGPIFSGIVYEIFNDYQIVFITNAVLMIFLFIICCACVWNTQKDIETMQISFFTKITPTIIDAPNNENDQLVSANKEEHINDNQIFPSFIASTKDHSEQVNQLLFFKKLSPLRFYLIINIIIELGIFFTFEAVFVTYFVPFMLRKFQNNSHIVLFATLQIFSLFVLSLLSFIMTPKIYKRVAGCEYILVIMACILLFICNYCYLFDANSIHWFWANTMLSGGAQGMAIIVLEYLLLDVIPPKDSGKVNAIRALFHNIIRSFYLLFVGIYWEHDSMVYVLSIACVVGLILHCVMLLVNRIFGCAQIDSDDNIN